MAGRTPDATAWTAFNQFQADVNRQTKSAHSTHALLCPKGGRLLVMVRKLIGEEAFRAGLKYILKNSHNKKHCRK